MSNEEASHHGGNSSDSENDEDRDLPSERSTEGSIADGDEILDDEDLKTGLEETNFEESNVLAPAAPKANILQEKLNEVSSSPAYQCLDDLLQEGKLTATKVAHFKEKYQRMHDILKNARENEIKLLQRAKEYSAQVDRQKLDLQDSAEKFPENAGTSEVSRLRLSLLKYNNDYAETEDANYHLQYKIENLKDERDIIKREWDRLPKQEELEKRVRELQMGIDDLSREISQRQTDLKSLKEDLENHRRVQDSEAKEVDVLREKHEELKGDYLVALQAPQDIQREVDRLLRHKVEAEKESTEVNKKAQELFETLKKFEVKCRSLEEHRHEAEVELDKKKTIVAEAQRELELWQKEYELINERETILIGDKATLDVQMKHMLSEIRHLREIASRQQHERDAELHELRKWEIQLKASKDSLRLTEESHKRTLQAKSLLPPPNVYFGDIEKLTKMKHELQKTYVSEDSVTAKHKAQVEGMIREEERLLHDQKTLRILVIELTRLAAIKADEREQKSRDFVRAEKRHKRAMAEFHMKGLIIEDHRKKHQLLRAKLEEYSDMYTVVKNERNKCVSQIQVAVQKLSEMKEKWKVLQNEIDILRSTIRTKEKQLQKEKLKHINEIVIRDSVRTELGKAQIHQGVLSSEQNQQKLQLNQLNDLTAKAEDGMIALRKQFEREVQKRNQRGVQLIERNEEICVFYERLNAQMAVIKSAEVELAARNEEVQLLSIQKKEDYRTIELLRKRTQDHRRYNELVTTLQIQLSQCQDRLADMEKRVSEPGVDKGRFRFLDGEVPDAGEVKDKSDQLEMRLAEKEEQYFEKQLLIDQLDKLIERMDSRTGGTRGDTLRLAKTVNEYSGKLRDVTRKLMALVSELSMRQAESMKLGAEVNERETLLQECYQRMERGEPPTQEIALAWEKDMLAEERRRNWTAEGQQPMANYGPQLYPLTAGGFTAAEPRPNAYVPTEDTGELPVPKPYGNQAPFKPQAPGTNMRHIRKPVPKPIEI